MEKNLYTDQVTFFHFFADFSRVINYREMQTNFYFYKEDLSIFYILFLITFQVNLCSHYFIFSKKVQDANVPYKHKKDKNNKGLDVGNFGILSVVLCSTSTPVYVET